MSPLKVLLFTPYYYPDFGPSAPIYTDLCEDLHKMGCNVTVVTAFPHYSEAQLAQNPHRPLFTHEVYNGVNIVRCYVYSVSKATTWKRMIYHGSFNLFSTLASLRVKNPDIILADAPMLWSGLSLVVKAIWAKVPFIYIIHDIYPDVLVRLGVLTNPKLIALIDRIERAFYVRASGISVLSQGFKENLLRKSIPSEKIAVIPACVDANFFRPLPRENELRRTLHLGDKFVFLYAGNIGYSQGLDSVLSAAQDLKETSDILFLFVGEGATKENLLGEASRKGLTNVKFIPFVPREQVPLLYGLADVCLVSLKQGLVVESVPSKTYTIMASGRPILASVDKNTEAARLVKVSGCGLLVEPGNPRAITDSLLSLYRNERLRSQMGNCGREYAFNHYRREIAAKEYYSFILKNLNNGGASS